MNWKSAAVFCACVTVTCFMLHSGVIDPASGLVIGSPGNSAYSSGTTCSGWPLAGVPTQSGGSASVLGVQGSPKATFLSSSLTMP